MPLLLHIDFPVKQLFNRKTTVKINPNTHLRATWSELKTNSVCREFSFCFLLSVRADRFLTFERETHVVWD